MTIVRRKRWVWTVVAAVAVICAATAGIWVFRQHAEKASSRADCAVVKQLADKWEDVAAASWHGDAKTDDWRALSNQVRDNIDSVSSATIRTQMNQWADGFDKQAEVQQDLSNPPPHGPRPNEGPKLQEAGTLTYGAANLLRAECPDVWPKDRQYEWAK